MTTFRVNAIPVAQPRQRHRVIKTGGKSFAQNYTPASDPVNAFKAHLRLAAQQADVKPIRGPISVTLRCYFPRLKAHYRTNGQLKPSAPTFKESKPDHDNLAKSVCDALNGIAWHDDAQIVDGRTVKLYATDDEPVGVLVEIEQI